MTPVEAPRVPSVDARIPGPRVAASCDWCGSTEAVPVTGRIGDAEGEESLPPAFRDERFQFVRCQGCGLVYLPSRPSPQDLAVYYSESYKCFQSYEDRGAVLRWLADRVARGKLKEIRALMPQGNRTLLDYGCGTGTWLCQLRRLGCDLDMIGMDVVEGPLPRLREQGIPAHCCDEDTIFDHIAPGSVGVIHLFHVIEHLPSPKKVLGRLKETLTPGGVILGQTPNVASVGCRFWGDLWNQWHAPYHFVLFDHDTLRRHAEGVGLEVVRIRNSLSGATQWAQGLTHWIARKRGQPFRGIHEPLYPWLILAFLPPTVLESLVARTCHMDFILRRPIGA